MKLLPVLPLTIVGKSASGLAIRVIPTTNPECLFAPKRVSPFSLWLPLSCVSIEKGKVVAVADWLRKKNRLAPAVASE